MSNEAAPLPPSDDRESVDAGERPPLTADDIDWKKPISERTEEEAKFIGDRLVERRLGRVAYIREEDFHNYRRR